MSVIEEKKLSNDYPFLDNVFLEDLYIRMTTKGKKKPSKMLSKSAPLKKIDEKELNTIDKLELEKYKAIADYIESEYHCSYENRSSLNILVMTSLLNKRAYCLSDMLKSKSWVSVYTETILQGPTADFKTSIERIAKGKFNIVVIVDLLEYAPSPIALANSIRVGVRALRPPEFFISFVLFFGRDIDGAKNLALEDGYTLTSNGYKTAIDVYFKGFRDFTDFINTLFFARCKEILMTNSMKNLNNTFKKLDPHHMFTAGV